MKPEIFFLLLICSSFLSINLFNSLFFRLIKIRLCVYDHIIKQFEVLLFSLVFFLYFFHPRIFFNYFMWTHQSKENIVFVVVVVINCIKCPYAVRSDKLIMTFLTWFSGRGKRLNSKMVPMWRNEITVVRLDFQPYFKLLSSIHIQNVPTSKWANNKFV